MHTPYQANLEGVVAHTLPSLIPVRPSNGWELYVAVSREARQTGRLRDGKHREPAKPSWQAMAARLGTPEGKALYRQRSAMIEPVFAQLFARLGRDLHYRDTNLPGRAGWKEIVVTGGSGVKLVQSSVPARDRSRELAEYPTDLLTSPPQDLEAHVVFMREGLPVSGPLPTIDEKRAFL